MIGGSEHPADRIQRSALDHVQHLDALTGRPEDHTDFGRRARMYIDVESLNRATSGETVTLFWAAIVFKASLTSCRTSGSNSSSAQLARRW